MKLFVNASQVFGTGVVQVSVSFIEECRNFPEHQYFVFVSKMAAQQLNVESFPSNFLFEVFENHSAISLGSFQLQYYLRKREIELNPDCTFTLFGPTIWKPKSPHLVGFAYPYFVYPESPFFRIISKKFWMKIKVNSFIFKLLFNRNSDYFVSETDDVTNRLQVFLSKKSNKYYTVTNTCNHFFLDFDSDNLKLEMPPKKKNEFRFVTLSTFATHKNLTILNKVIPLLRESLPDIDCKFVLTVDNNLLLSNIKDDVRSAIINLGRIKVDECPSVYYHSDALFLPTLLECFSASYAEAMKMRRPILTSDLPFAKTVCGDAAIYFDPLDPIDIVKKIKILIESKELKQDLITKGMNRVSTFDNALTRTKKYLEICNQIAK